MPEGIIIDKSCYLGILPTLYLVTVVYFLVREVRDMDRIGKLPLQEAAEALRAKRIIDRCDECIVVHFRARWFRYFAIAIWAQFTAQGVLGFVWLGDLTVGTLIVIVATYISYITIRVERGDKMWIVHSVAKFACTPVFTRRVWASELEFDQAWSEREGDVTAWLVAKPVHREGWTRVTPKFVPILSPGLTDTTLSLVARVLNAYMRGELT